MGDTRLQEEVYIGEGRVMEGGHHRLWVLQVLENGVGTDTTATMEGSMAFQ